MNLYRRVRSPFWWADVTVDEGRHRFSTKRRHLLPIDTDDIPKRLSPAQAEARREAEAVVANFIKRHLDTSQLGKLEQKTLREATELYLPKMKNARDYRNIESRVRKILGDGDEYAGRYHLDPDMLFHNLTTAVVETLKSKRSAEGNAPRTINHEVGILGHIYRTIAEGGDILVKHGVKFKKLPTQDKLRWLTEDEEMRLLSQLEPKRDITYTFKHTDKDRTVTVRFDDQTPEMQRKLQDQYDLTIFLLDTGARYSEISTITWDVIDTNNWKTVNLYRWKVNNESVLAMTKRLREILKRRWSKRLNSIYVFPGYGEADGPRGHATTGITKAINRAGLNPQHLIKKYGKATVHTFRDTFASRLIQGKRGTTPGSWLVRPVPLERVSKLLGHADVKQTQKYAHLVPSDVAEEAVLALDALHEVRASA